MGANPSSGVVTLTDCTLTANTAQGGRGGAGETGSNGGSGGDGYGGAIFNLDGSVTLYDDTVDGNSTVAGAGGDLNFLGQPNPGSANGGAVYNLAFGNYIPSGRAISAVLHLFNSILADSTGGSDLASRAFNGKGINQDEIDGSTNLFSNKPNISNSTIFQNSVIKIIASPNLGPLKDNGGPKETLTMAVPLFSPAFWKGDPNAPGVPKTDQRGFARVVGGLDLGAYENQLIIIHFAPAQIMGAGAGAVSEGDVTFSVLGQNLVVPVQGGSANGPLTIPGGTASAMASEPFSVTVACTVESPDDLGSLRDVSTTWTVIPADGRTVRDRFGSGIRSLRSPGPEAERGLTVR
jgi:hypothetical protein